MEYFAGLDISMKETHICVVDRDGKVVYEAKAFTSPAAIAAELAKAPAAQRVVFETGRMATTLYHGLQALGLPVVCIESRHAYQSLKSLATHKTDRNDARGLAHLARTGFYKPVHAAGHHDIGEDERDIGGSVQPLQRLLGVDGFERAIAEVAQLRDRGAPHVGVVLDHQDQFAMQAEHRMGGRLGVAEDAEDAALLAEMVVVEGVGRDALCHCVLCSTVLFKALRSASL